MIIAGCAMRTGKKLSGLIDIDQCFLGLLDVK